MKATKLKAFEYFFLTYYIEKIRTNKGSRQEVLYKKSVFKNFTKLIGKKLCRSLFLIKFQAGSLQRDWQKCFPINFANFLRTNILENICEGLLLHKNDCFYRGITPLL